MMIMILSRAGPDAPLKAFIVSVIHFFENIKKHGIEMKKNSKTIYVMSFIAIIIIPNEIYKIKYFLRSGVRRPGAGSDALLEGARCPPPYIFHLI